MAKMRETSTSKRNQLPLWLWGLILIFAGIVSNVVVDNLPIRLLPPPANSAEARGQAFGQGLVTAIGIIAGIVLIVLHFTRRHQRSGVKQRKSTKT